VAHNCGDIGVSFRVILTAALVASACGRLGSGFDLQVRQYAGLTVALGERDPDSIDFYYGPEQWVSDVRKNPPRLEEIRRSALELARQLQPDRRLRAKRLARQAEAIAARADELLGKKESFDERTSAYFGVTISPADSGALEQTRSQLALLLTGRGSLAERYAAFDEEFLVPGDRLPAVMARAMQGCRDQTRNHLRLPAGEQVRIEYVHGRPWSAFSHYQGNFQSVISVNADLPLTVDRVLQLACHEGYPGHHAQNVLQELQLVRDQHWMEWTVRPTFSPQSLVSEALATFAINVTFPAAERLRFERDALFPLAGLDAKNAGKYIRVERLVDELQSAEPAIARDFVDGKLEWARAADALERQALMTHPEETLKYINEYRSYMITYTLGPELVAKQVRDWRQFEELMTDPEAANRLMMKR
jgi:hypothetical protein